MFSNVQANTPRTKQSTASARSAPSFKVVRKSTSKVSEQPAKKHKMAEAAVGDVPAVAESENASAGGLAALMGDYSDSSD